MIKAWRIARLQRQITEQCTRVRLLEKAAGRFNVSYFIDRHIDAECRLAVMQFDLRKLTGEGEG